MGTHLPTVPSSPIYHDKGNPASWNNSCFEQFTLSSCKGTQKHARAWRHRLTTAWLLHFSPGPDVCKTGCLLPLQLSQASVFFRFVADEDRLGKRDVLVVSFQSDLCNSWGRLFALPDTSFQVSHFCLSVPQLCRTQTQCFSLLKETEGSIASPGHRWKLPEPIILLHKLLQHLRFVGFGDFCLFACFGTTDIHLPSDPEPLAIPLEQHSPRAGTIHVETWQSWWRQPWKISSTLNCWILAAAGWDVQVQQRQSYAQSKGKAQGKWFIF